MAIHPEMGWLLMAENTETLRAQDAHTCLDLARHSPHNCRLYSKMNQSTSFYKEFDLCSNFSAELCYKQSQNIRGPKGLWEAFTHPKPNPHQHQHLTLRLEQCSRHGERWKGSVCSRKKSRSCVRDLSQAHSPEMSPRIWAHQNCGHSPEGQDRDRIGRGIGERIETPFCVNIYLKNVPFRVDWCDIIL